MSNLYPEQMTNDEKMTELIKNQRELLIMQQINTLLTLSQNPNVIESIREIAKFDALALIAGSRLGSEELKDATVKEWYRIKERKEELQRHEETKNNLSQQFK